MGNFGINSAIVTAIVTTGLAAQVQAGLLTYEVNGPPVLDGNYVAGSYGDVADLVDVTHELVNSSGVATQTMLWWPGGYDDLSGVGWGGSSGGGDRGRVTLASVNSSTVTLNSFDLGIWVTGRGPDETVNIFEIGDLNPLLSYSINEQSNQHWSFDIGLSSMTGFIIEWTSPWWVAIDNLDSSAGITEVVATPEPASAALMLLGIAGLARMRRRSKPVEQEVA